MKTGEQSIIVRAYTEADLPAMAVIAKTENKIRKWLLVSAILFALFFAGMLIYYIAVHERWQLWAPIAALMLISAAHAVRLYRFIKRECAKKVD